MHFDQILESISGGFFALDEQFRFTYWNHAAEEGTGIPRADVLGKHVFEVFPNAEKAELGEQYLEAMRTKTFRSLVSSYRDDRFEKWFDTRIYPSDNGLSVFFQDVTEQKQQERRQETLLEISHIINTAGQLEDLCLMIVECLSNRYDLPPENVLLYMNRHHDQQLVLLAPGFSSAEQYQNLYTIPLEEKQSLAAVEAFRTGTPVLTMDLARSVLYEVAPQQVISTKRSTLLAFPLKVENEIVGVIEIRLNADRAMAEKEISFLTVIANEVAVGISRRGLIDELRVKNVDLEIQRGQTVEAHDTLKRFLAFFSHELRSPLSSIIGFSKLLSEERASLDEASTVDYLNTIHSSGMHLLQLINDILDLSKIEAGKMELHFESIPLRFFLDSIIMTVQPASAEKKLSIEVNVDEELDDIIADPVRLKQILLNLVTNAVKFSYPEGKIIIKARRNQNDIEFSVQDFGIGIRSDDVAKLFQPFQQTDAAVKKEGTGLGLSITKKLVELHGGSVFVVSEWQSGSTFIVRVPMMVKAESGPGKFVQKLSVMQAAANTPLRVLVVEDKTHARTLLRTYLHDAGYVTEVATNGVEALEKAKLWKPDVITLDILLPVKDGWQVLRELKEHPLCKDIPVIIISMVDERNVGFGLGAVDYFVKPVQKEELLAAIKKIPVHIQRNRSTAKILVVDDDKSVTDLIQVILESEGCTVLKAFNGKDGLQLAESEHPDLIILDLVMPEMSGFNVAYQLKHNPATYTIPVMIMTSMEIDEETREQLQGFVVSLMRKSGFTKRDLLNEIASIEGKKG